MQENIRIGTLVQGNGDDPAGYIRQILPHGFESLQMFFWQTLKGRDLRLFADEVKVAIGDNDVTVSSIGIFGNPLENTDIDRETQAGWEEAIDAAPLFGANVVNGFTGRLRGKSIPDSLPAFKAFFGPLAKRAADNGVKIAFENCPMGGSWASGDWNIAHNPAAWGLMFDALPDDNIGVEWETCHQMTQLIDPLPQLRTWTPKIFHVHGKCATIRQDIIREFGVFGPQEWAFHRHPGFGDCDWTQVISELRRFGYVGTIDIEGWHDPVYVGEWEMTGQVHALNYLKRCRGGDFVPNPA